MATVNLGSIKFKWKGTYNGATAYTVDDVVSYNGSSYICILASTGNLPTNATYFEQMSSAGTNGTNGTDLTTTLTTQGDILYRDGSGLQRLGIGSAGEALKVNSGATAIEWGSAGGLVSTGFYRDVGSQTLTATSPTAITTATFTISGTAGDKIIIHYSPTGYQNVDDKATQFDLYMTEQGGAAQSISTTASGSGGMGMSSTGIYYWYWAAFAFDHGFPPSGMWHWTFQTTGTHTIQAYTWSAAGNDTRIGGGSFNYWITKV